MAILPAPLETARFGVVCAKLDPSDPRSRDLNKVNRNARRDAVRLLTVRVDVSDLDFLHQLETDGFQLMDTLVYYERSLDNLPAAPPIADEVEIRCGRPEDAVGVEAIARMAFEGYLGHYHADPRLDNEAATEGYAEWSRSFATNCNAEDSLMVATLSGELCGFMAFSTNETVDLKLSGIDQRVRRKGLYAALFFAALKSAKSTGSIRAMTSTQINNYPVQRVWSRFGFVHERSFYTLHKWFD